MAGISDDQLKALIDGEMRTAIGFFGGRLANQRQKALWYYEGLAKGDLAPPEVEGRSSVVATEVRNVVLSIMPALMEKFASGDAIVECSPRAEKYEQGTEDASEYLNWLFLSQLQGWKILETAFFDALISKCGFVKVWYDARAEETREEYRGLNQFELADLLDDDEIEVIEHESVDDESAIKEKNAHVALLQAQLQQANQDAALGNPQAQQAIESLQQQISGLEAQPIPKVHNVACKRTKRGGKVCVENVPPEELMISRKMKSLDWTKEPNYFVGHRLLRSASELKSMGYKNVDQITSDDNQTLMSMERVERLMWDDDMAYLTQTDAPSYDPSQRLIWLTEAYCKADRNGDGIAELLKVTKAGNEILEVEEIDFPPFAVFRPIVMPHRFFGLSVADLAMEPQRIKTVVLRNILDNLSFTTNGRYYAVENQVNLDDLLTSRPGGVVRVKTPEAVGALVQGNADTNGAMNVLQYMQGFTEEATGWSRQANQLDNPDSLNTTATAANLANNKASQRMDMIARNLSDGVVDMFRLMLKLICQHQDSIQDVKVNGRWMQIDPREWANQFDLQIAVGLGTGSKDQQVQHMTMLMQHQGAQLQAGLHTVTPENIFKSSEKLAHALGYRNAELFFTDPAKLPPQAQKPDPEMLKIQMQQYADQQKFQAQTQIEYAKQQMEMEKEKNQQEMQAKERALELKLENERNQQQAHYQAQIDMLKASHESEIEKQRIAFDTWKAKLDSETKIMIAQLSAQTAANAQQMAAARQFEDHA